MGEIRVPTLVGDTSHWSPYMARHLREVIESWVKLVESGAASHDVRIGNDQPTTEHLRIAKAFLTDFITSVYDQDIPDVDPARWGPVGVTTPDGEWVNQPSSERR